MSCCSIVTVHRETGHLNLHIPDFKLELSLNHCWPIVLRPCDRGEERLSTQRVTFAIQSVMSNTQVNTLPIAIAVLEQVSMSRPSHILLFPFSSQDWILWTAIVRTPDIPRSCDVDLMALESRALGSQQIIPVVFPIYVRPFGIAQVRSAFP